MGLGIELMPKTVNTTTHSNMASSSNVAKSIRNKSSKNSSTKKTAIVNKTKTTTTASNVANKSQTVTGQLKIHYINVGQGDSELIQNNGQNMLIDTGTNTSTSSLISYLQNQTEKNVSCIINKVIEEKYSK